LDDDQQHAFVVGHLDRVVRGEVGAARSTKRRVELPIHPGFAA
jgi:hypothetical protein